MPELTVRPGTLTVLDGMDGTGKSTQIRRLAETLTTRGHTVLALREPGGTSIGTDLRRLLMDVRSNIHERTELLLFLASRAQLVAQEIVPALTRGDTVLLDRFFLTTLAYQVAGHRLPEAPIRTANAFAIGDVVPDLQIVLDIGSSERLTRMASRGERDRMEMYGPDFYDRAYAAFASFSTPEWQREHPEAGLVVSVDASGSEENVADRILSAFDNAALHRRSVSPRNTVAPLAGLAPALFREAAL